MIGNLDGNGIAVQINLLGATVNPVRLVRAGGGASLAGVCLTTGGPAYALNMATFATVIACEPLGPARALGPMITSTVVATGRMKLSGGVPVVDGLLPERLSAGGWVETVGGRGG